ncbi:MAG: hypothetical protein A2504_03460 [Bdellovibrionales bacterium RIFOXYD12_FULL_39_22]|nr:MAG: hypothetical protein A2385_15870 [Bdellovibrionales bacterium RIFOXYB1_FULL_39_21]OFZ41581.1 MAG: hypothetical protein A2485_02560 [Bdellovibrionales bacterium RIFOXYC12_FULL_39_17]OFZ45894.1 MAG: hypothetical protein A2404_12925 [Bdellovibrionales bacterium RIFOXYC1_FULL_39_130]OFZ74826.1 MAG: hypothetical protein A2560_10355 [Bdellovibrionales bacterium RIFOXYD1_FULL_39_84]OFZ92686.1 MAG: hypothetical protein A2504_03460 [Bdellovibrionales bacterium RIFOXYD12_FULL_39_22]HLE11264.1 Om
MKNLFLLGLFLAFGFNAYGAIVVGSVDIQKVLVTVKEGEKVKSKLKGAYDEKQKILKVDEEKIKGMQQDYQKQSLVMSADAKQKKEMEIQKLIVEIQQASMKYQKELQDMEQTMKKPILEKIQKIVEEVSVTAKVDMTFESSTAPVIYAKDQKDLTEEVITLYDKKYPSK